MASRLPLLVFRLTLLIALGVSAALLIDYFRPLPAFCDIGSGCDRVRASGYARVLGIPLPLIGAVGFVALMALSLQDTDRADRLARVLASLVGITGLALLLTQALVLQVFCKLCVTVDLSSIVIALAALWPASWPASSPRPSMRLRWLWPLATAGSLLLPAAWAVLQPSPPVPPEIAG